MKSPTAGQTPIAEQRSRGRTKLPLTARRLVLRLVPLLAVALVLLSLRWTDVSPSALAEGADATNRLLGRMVPPDVSRLGDILRLTWQTLLIAVAGTGVALALSLPLSFLAASNTAPNRLVRAVARAVIAVTRAIPTLVFAIIFVRALGLGPFPGAIAVALHSIGMLGKLFADAIEQANPLPTEAVEATGAGRVQAVAAAILPQVAPAIIGLTLYRLDINVRASSVLGLVGAGGIGVALNTALGTLNYPRALGIILVIFALILVIEQVSVVLRRAMLGTSAAPVRSGPVEGRFEAWMAARALPPLVGPARMKVLGVLAFVGLFLWSIPGLGISAERIAASGPRLIDMGARMWPPAFGDAGMAVFEGLLESLWMGIAATGLGVLGAVPLAVLAADTTTPSRWLGRIVRYGVVAIRGVPELIIALLFVAAVGLGPFAGVMALSIAMLAFAAKLFMDALEELDDAPVEALRASGATRLQQLVSGVWPQFLPGFIGGTLFVVDLAMRQSVILGIVGAGGIGFLLQQSVSTLQYDVTAVILLFVFIAVQCIETIANGLRRLLL